MKEGVYLIQIAIYGKGGIGKSTISANISAALADMDKRVLQIGCDPKHDSTNLLLGGMEIDTVLDYLRDRAPQDCKLSDIMYQGYGGIHCIEAGGPEPGVGCAGRGILTTFETIERLGLRYSNYDLVLYDVLGDVVCGGFAVPLRQEYAKRVYIVTSGEFMSIYAANNILRGVSNYSSEKPRIGGIIYNSRNVEGENARVHEFSKAVGVPVIAEIPRSQLFAECEKSGQCLVEKYPNSPIAGIFKDLASRIMANKDGYVARPLSDSDLEKTVLGLERTKAKTQRVESETFVPAEDDVVYSKNLLNREPFHGCAYSGGASIAVQLRDAVVVSNGPKSCSHITYQTLSSLGRRSVFEKSIVLPIQVKIPLETSAMDESIMVFGGNQLLIDKINEIKKDNPPLIIVVTTCPSGIIGEPVEEVLALSDENTKVLALMTEGNITGDFMQGMIRAYFEIGDALIDQSVEPKQGLYNIFGEKTIANATDPNFRKINEWMNLLGYDINCRYLLNTTVDSVINMKAASVNILCDDSYMSRILKEHFEKTAGLKFFDLPIPIGFDDSVKWIREMSRLAGKEDVGEKIIEEEIAIYHEAIEKLKPSLKGKRLMVVSYNHSLDWILKTAIDLEMRLVKVGILNFSQDMNFRSKYENCIENLETDYTAEKREKDLYYYKPDLLIGNYNSNIGLEGLKMDNIPLCPDAGFLSGVKFAERWAELFKLDLEEGWKKDEYLFKRYYG